MSNFLLEKSLRLFQGNNHNKKTKKSRLEKLRKKKLKLSEKTEEDIEYSICKNIKLIEKVNKQFLVDVPKEILLCNNENGNEDKDSQLKEKESSIFTEEDFEKFEKEYLDS